MAGSALNQLFACFEVFGVIFLFLNAKLVSYDSPNVIVAANRENEIIHGAARPFCCIKRLQSFWTVHAFEGSWLVIFVDGCPFANVVELFAAALDGCLKLVGQVVPRRHIALEF